MILVTRKVQLSPVKVAEPPIPPGVGDTETEVAFAAVPVNRRVSEDMVAGGAKITKLTWQATSQSKSSQSTCPSSSLSWLSAQTSWTRGGNSVAISHSEAVKANTAAMLP